MSVDLDNPRLREEVDPQQMLLCVEQFHKQCADGEKLARGFDLPRFKKIEQIVLCGMGGSAINGDLLRAYTARQVSLPVEVVRHYSLPEYVGKKTLAILCSYSGNTEETLSAYQEAKQRSAKMVAVTTGGALAQQCDRDGVPWMRIPGGYAPRAALGYSFMPLLVFFERWGLIKDQTRALKQTKKTLKASIRANSFTVPEKENPAKQLARKLFNKIPVIYADQEIFQPVAVRWRGQFNENAKTFVHTAVIPEMNHNEILGWENPATALKKFHAVYLTDEGYHPQIKKRFDIMKKILSPFTGDIIEVYSQGKGRLARMFSTINLGDFTSVYLAYLYGVDPTRIPAIDSLKEELAK